VKILNGICVLVSSSFSNQNFLGHLCKVTCLKTDVNTFFGNLWIIIFQKWNPKKPYVIQITHKLLFGPSG
jgi:hypothetical protein